MDGGDDTDFLTLMSCFQNTQSYTSNFKPIALTFTSSKSKSHIFVKVKIQPHVKNIFQWGRGIEKIFITLKRQSLLWDEKSAAVMMYRKEI